MADKITGAEKLRHTVNWIDYQRETFLDEFTAEQLLKLHGYALAHPELPEFADSWERRDIAKALRAPKT
jgi:hypothetical protein